MNAPSSHRPAGLLSPAISCQIEGLTMRLVPEELDWQPAKDPVKQTEATAVTYFNVYGIVRSRFDILLPEDDDDDSEPSETAQDTSQKVAPASRLRNQAGWFSCHRTCCRRCRW